MSSAKKIPRHFSGYRKHGQQGLAARWDRRQVQGDEGRIHVQPANV